MADGTPPHVVRQYWWLPLVGVAMAVVTLVATFTVFYTQDRKYGGIDFAYISDTGRKYPEKYIFVVGMSMLAVLSVAGHWLVTIWLKVFLIRANANKLVSLNNVPVCAR
jgi:uncharacterized membrane protein